MVSTLSVKLLLSMQGGADLGCSRSGGASASGTYSTWIGHAIDTSKTDRELDTSKTDRELDTSKIES